MKIFSRNILIFFLIFVRNIDCGYTLEQSRRGGSNEYHNLCFVAKIRLIGIPMSTPILEYESVV